MTPSLIARLQSAERGEPSLDAEIARGFGFTVIDRHSRHDYEWRPDDKGIWRSLPTFTTSLDAALALAERVLGHTEMRLDIGSHGGARAIVEHEHASHIGEGLSPALALCAAILTALSQSGARR